MPLGTNGNDVFDVDDGTGSYLGIAAGATASPGPCATLKGSLDHISKTCSPGPPPATSSMGLGATMFSGHVTGASGKVWRFQKAVPQRIPDAGGHQNWLGNPRNDDTTLLEVSHSLLKSPAFTAPFADVNSGGEFVTLLLSNVRGRTSDPRNFRNSVTSLAVGERTEAEIVLAISKSAEFRPNTRGAIELFAAARGDQTGSVDVFPIYHATFDRTPDKGSFLDWIERFADGLPIETGFARFFASA